MARDTTLVWRICLSILLLSVGAAKGRTILQFTSESKPTVIALPVSGIFLHSDTLRLNQRELARGADYSADYDKREISIATLSLQMGDTLWVVYHEIPAWLSNAYGRPIPDAASTLISPPVPEGDEISPLQSNLSRDLHISGAKTFRFSSGTIGEADFGQSLDLRINGEISPGLELSGALTDRGYDPTYGTSTSRLNELDKLNLRLRSTNLLAMIGDINLPSTSGRPSKSVSGASVALNYPNWNLAAGAARPRGRFQSSKLTGQDGFQGPYRMGGEGASSPVVPGSETVWLDGQPLHRGADKDYLVDYPTGEITFTARQFIDRRSRIEVDFEPLATEYRQELLSMGGGFTLNDSLVWASASVIREGDDKSQLLVGELSESDQALLESAGDNDLYVSGVQADTSGDYVLVTDSLPDTVWSYVGESNGDYRVTFTYVGPLQGSYRYVGGRNYQFVGASKGDYLPVRGLPRPELTEYYQAGLGFNTLLGQFSADLRQNSRDRNLWSTLDDSDNDGVFYQLDYSKSWRWKSQPGIIRLSRRLREFRFLARERVDQADFNRTFLIPANGTGQVDEVLQSAQATISPGSGIRLSPHIQRITYEDNFHALAAQVDAVIQPAKWLQLHSNMHRTDATLDTSAVESNGTSKGLLTQARLDFAKSYSVSVGYETDHRENSYSGRTAGTRFDRWEISSGSAYESVKYERYSEDSLDTNWSVSTKRDRVSLLSSRQIRNLNYSAELGWQQIDEMSSRSSSFLGRTSLGYNDAPRRLQLQTSYLISDELRNERGITYLEVEQGRGNYSLENGKYIPDPFGNYIQVEELLSDRAAVHRGEKSFLLSREFSFAAVRLSSNIREELLDGEKRSAWWIVPFLTDASKQYLQLSRRYDAEIRLIPWNNFYAVNLTLQQELDRRRIGGADNESQGRRGNLTLKQAAATLQIEQSVDLFKTERDDYYVGAGSSRGFRATAQMRRVGPTLEWNGGGTVRRAKSTSGDKADLEAILLGMKLKALQKGELRTDLELYHQNLAVTSSNYSYELTDNHNGKTGAVWSVALRYSIRSGLQANLTFTGRHSDDRAGRVSGRGEMVATF